MRGRWRGSWTRGILWDDENLEHVARHGVAAEEVEEALAGRPFVLRSRDGRYLVYGSSTEGRFLFIVCVRKGGGLVRPLTARDMTEVEKRLYRRKQRGRP
jgi:uncharacterized DUF497 family protein